jgi:aminoacyl tRNA synthase complex-interacting multifunctional protein 1
LNLNPGESVVTPGAPLSPPLDAANNNNKKKKVKKAQPPPKKPAEANHDQPDICKLEFKVGEITKLRVHPTADKLYCEEINVGEVLFCVDPFFFC